MTLITPPNNPETDVAATGHPFNTTSAPKSVPTVCSLCGGKGCGHCVGSGPKIVHAGTSVIAPGGVMISFPIGGTSRHTPGGAL